MISHLTPSQYVIRIFGGVRKLSKAIGRTPASVSKWGKSRSEKGCGGNIPTNAQIIILEIARQRKLDINPQDLVIGKNIQV